MTIFCNLNKGSGFKTSNKIQVDIKIDDKNSYLVKARAQLGEEEVTPKIFLVKEELHLATIPLVGRFENNSFLIH